ncbi:hypothetical protein [Cupriavidus alkaliphilus]|uniref:hypothetical protein n=1 Tax=Cupriavidus alkaliphilus TaxID=942866 RepID=UPI001057FEEE|nr:hypothetical protein [Cupriavidus alkaliphilus]
MKKRALAALLICAISISSYASDRLNLGQKLYFGQNIESPNGQYRLHMESDQRLVLRQSGVEIWHVKGQYSEDRGAVRAELRSILGIISLDLINYRDETVWSNPRWNYPGGVVPRLTHLQVQNDGNVVLYTRLNAE